MAWPVSLGWALKEWAAVCAALEGARQIVLLRKGGIYEAAGEFEVEHPEFLLFPTYLHQNLKSLKSSEHAGFEERAAEPQRVNLSAAGVVTDIVQLRSRAQMEAIDAEHVWEKPLIDMRFNYRPENPLYLLLVRVYRLREAVVVENTPEYAGCKSWVPLTAEVATGGAAAVMDDASYEVTRKRILERVGAVQKSA